MNAISSHVLQSKPFRFPVFVVDDNAEIAEIIAGCLRQQTNVEVRTFTSGVTALEAYLADVSACGLVVSDFDMPGMSGSEMLSAMRFRSPALRAMVFSGRSLDEISEGGLPKGIQYFAKPNGFKDLIDAVVRQAACAREPERSYLPAAAA